MMTRCAYVYRYRLIVAICAVVCLILVSAKLAHVWWASWDRGPYVLVGSVVMVAVVVASLVVACVVMVFAFAW